MFEYTKKVWQGFQRDESGATAIEYAMIAAIIGLGIIAGAILVSDSLDVVFTDVKGGFDTALG